MNKNITKKERFIQIIIVVAVINLIILWILLGKKPLYHTYNGVVYKYDYYIKSEIIDECKITISGYTNDFVLPFDTHNIIIFIGSIKFDDIKIDCCDFFISNNDWMKIVEHVREGSVIRYEEIGEIYLENHFKNIKLLIKKDINYNNVDYDTLLIESKP